MSQHILIPIHCNQKSAPPYQSRLIHIPVLKFCYSLLNCINKMTIFERIFNMNSSFKVITLVFILFAKMALGYYDLDLEQSKNVAGIYSAGHSEAVHQFDGPFVFENESRSESEDDNDDDDLDLTVAPYQVCNQAEPDSYLYKSQQKNLRNDNRLFILYGNFRL
jgi:hypothetical protein